MNKTNCTVKNPFSLTDMGIARSEFLEELGTINHYTISICGISQATS